MKAYKFIAESAKKYEGKIALICLGPLSNLALAYHYDNTIANCFSNVSIMGGSDTLAGLNISYSAEFNIGLDPEAGYIVFEKFNNIILTTLDTSVIGLDQKAIESLFHHDTTAKGALVADLFAYMGEKPHPNPPSYCDPIAVLVLFRPDVCTSGMQVRMKIKVYGKRTRGSSVIDYFEDNHKHNCYLIKSLDTKVILEETMCSY